MKPPNNYGCLLRLCFGYPWPSEVRQKILPGGVARVRRGLKSPPLLPHSPPGDSEALSFHPQPPLLPTDRQQRWAASLQEGSISARQLFLSRYSELCGKEAPHLFLTHETQNCTRKKYPTLCSSTKDHKGQRNESVEQVWG